MRGRLLRVADFFSTTWELFKYLWQQRLWWLIPMVVALILLSALVILGQATPLGPFIYTLF